MVASQVKELFGITGAADMGLYLAHFDEKTQSAIFRFTHKEGYRLITAVSFCTNYNNRDLYLFPEKTSGTLKKIKTFIANDKKSKDLIKILLE